MFVFPWIDVITTNVICPFLALTGNALEPEFPNHLVATSEVLFFIRSQEHRSESIFP